METANKNIKSRPSGLDRRYAPASYVGRCHRMKLIFLFVIVSMFLSACNTEQGLVGKRGETFRYEDQNLQSRVLTLLKQNEIQHIVENDFIVTLMKDTAEVRKIKRLAQYGESADSFRLESEVIVSNQHEEILTTRLDEAGVNYILDSMYGQRYVVWRVVQADVVDQVVEEVNLAIHEASKNN